jgi:hypothetical protein
MVAPHLQPTERDQQTGIDKRTWTLRSAGHLDAGDRGFESGLTGDIRLDDDQQIHMQGIDFLRYEFETLGGLGNGLGVEFEHAVALRLQRVQRGEAPRVGLRRKLQLGHL